MQSTVAVRSALILGALTIVALCTSAPMAVAAAGGLPVDGTATTTTAALCEPGVIEKMPPHIRKVCMALDSAAQLSASLFAYLHNQRSALLYQSDELPLPGSGIDKRTDVDHVFLRFGRRR